MEFETRFAKYQIRGISGVNLLRWSLKPLQEGFLYEGRKSVNLLRWSLKHHNAIFRGYESFCVNLPRWSLKQNIHDGTIGKLMYKFTQMEFETF